MQILVYLLIILFGVDLFFRYRAYKSGGGADATASNPTATAASGGEVPKYWWSKRLPKNYHEIKYICDM